jgi:hypothetical protein
MGTDGSDFFGELKRIGYAGKLAKPISVQAYYEFHIEQGPVLEQAQKPVGVVTGIQGVRWYEIEFVGRDAHAGTTPMAERQDSFMAAAGLALKLRDRATSHHPDLRFTVGRLEVSPNSQNTIPGNTRLFVDLRHGDSVLLDSFETIMVEELERTRQAELSQATMKRTMIVLPAIFDVSMQSRLQDSARSLGLELPHLPSGAMHDASSLAKQVPAAMLFVQSRGGVSHNPAEWSDPEHIELACEILARTILSHSMEVDFSRRFGARHASCGLAQRELVVIPDSPSIPPSPGRSPGSSASMSRTARPRCLPRSTCWTKPSSDRPWSATGIRSSSASSTASNAVRAEHSTSRHLLCLAGTPSKACTPSRHGAGSRTAFAIPSLNSRPLSPASFARATTASQNPSPGKLILTTASQRKTQGSKGRTHASRVRAFDILTRRHSHSIVPGGLDVTS